MRFFVKLLIKLVFNFVPIDDRDRGRITDEAEAWALKVSSDAENDIPQFWKTADVWLSKWGAQLAGAVVYIWAYKALDDLMNNNDPDEKTSAFK